MNDHWLKERYKDLPDTQLQDKLIAITWLGGTEEEEKEAVMIEAELKRREQENEQR